MKHLISKTMVAQMFGVTTKTISRWQVREKDPLPIAIKGARGIANQYDIAAVNDWGVRQALEKPRYRHAGKAYDYQKERARLTHNQAERAELENAITRGELIPADQVEETWTKHVLRMRARMLALPSRMAPELLGVESAEEAEKKLLVACTEVVAELPENGLPDEAQRRIDERRIRAWLTCSNRDLILQTLSGQAQFIHR